MANRILPTIAVALALFAAHAAVQADVWRWVDSAGRVHYSDVPIEGAVRIKSQVPKPEVRTSAGAPNGSAPAQPTLASNAVAIRERLDGEAAARAVAGDVQKKRAEQCTQAKEAYEKSIAARRLYREGKNGERVYLTDAELSQARVDARRALDGSCGATSPR